MVESGATRHICANINAFTSNTSAMDEKEHVYFADSRTTLIL